jgi:hypothetical protein
MREYTSSKRYFIIAGVILLGVFLRFSDSPPSSLWTDEFATYWIAAAPDISECIERAAPTQGQSPFYYILEWSVLQCVQHNEFSVRLISLGASLISIYLMYILGILLFEGRCIDGNRGEESDGSESISYSGFYSAIFAALLFAVNESSIYYAQEARPYALAVMFALLSQIFFLKLLRGFSGGGLLGYTLFSSLICYTHYIFGTLLLFQNIWMLYLFLRNIRRDIRGTVFFKDKSVSESIFSLFRELRCGGFSLFRWIIVQCLLIFTLIPLVFHLMPILADSGKWNWLNRGGFSEMLLIVGQMVDVKFIFFSVSLFIFLLTMKNLNQFRKVAPVVKAPSSSCYSRICDIRNIHILIFLGVWLIIPPLFAYFTTEFLHSSLLAKRYMILLYIPLFLSGGWCVYVLKSEIAKKLFIALILIFYSINVLIPNFLSEAHFSRRIQHDWRGALKYVKSNIKPDDSIILRSGFIKEDWLPERKNLIIKEYVQAPLRSFYFKDAKFAEIYNLTFSPSRDFLEYYQNLSDKLADTERIWIIGVSKPNNFPITHIPELFHGTHRIEFEKEFSGVFVTLLTKSVK